MDRWIDADRQRKVSFAVRMQRKISNKKMKKKKNSRLVTALKKKKNCT